jgi:hypothetical protein
MAKGTLVTLESMGLMLEETPKSSKFYSKIVSLRKELQNRSMFLDTELDKGYRIVDTDNSYNYVDGCIEKKKRLLGKQYKKIIHIPIQDMSEKARNEAIIGIQKHSALSVMISMGCKINWVK